MRKALLSVAAIILVVASLLVPAFSLVHDAVEPLEAVRLQSNSGAVPPGFDAASFARLGVGPRALGMAGAYVAIAEGASAGYWNPAGLAAMADFQTEGMYANWLGADIHCQYISLAGYPPLAVERPALRLGDKRIAFGLTWLSVRVEGIPWWEEETGGLGTFDAWSHLGVVSVAIPLAQTPSLAIGGSAKLYHDRILEGQSLGVGFDFGLLWLTDVNGVPVRLGLCTTDFGGTAIRWSSTVGQALNHVPWIVRVGGAVTLWEERFLLATSYEWGLNRPRFERLRVGGEVSLGGLSLRAGWDQPLAGEPGRLTVGVGIMPWPEIAVDYAFLPAGLGGTHLVSLNLTF